MSEPHQDFIPVHVFEGPVEKALVADVLRELDIPFLIDDHSLDQLGMILTPQLGAGRLMVLEGDQGRVAEILKELNDAAEPAGQRLQLPNSNATCSRTSGCWPGRTAKGSCTTSSTTLNS